jgi:hypothetical protein
MKDKEITPFVVQSLVVSNSTAVHDLGRVCRESFREFVKAYRESEWQKTIGDPPQNSVNPRPSFPAELKLNPRAKRPSGRILKPITHPTTQETALQTNFLPAYRIFNGVCEPITQERYDQDPEYSSVRKAFAAWEQSVRSAQEAELKAQQTARQWGFTSRDTGENPAAVSFEEALALGWAGEHLRIRYKTLRNFRRMLSRIYPFFDSGVITRAGCLRALELEYERQLRENALQKAQKAATRQKAATARQLANRADKRPATVQRKLPVK